MKLRNISRHLPRDKKTNHFKPSGTLRFNNKEILRFATDYIHTFRIVLKTVSDDFSTQPYLIAFLLSGRSVFTVRYQLNLEI